MAKDKELTLAKIANNAATKGKLQISASIADELERQLIVKAKGQKSKYISEEGYFKGKAGTGERFQNCIAYQKSQGKSDEAAHKICGAIAHGKGYGKPGKKPGTK